MAEDFEASNVVMRKPKDKGVRYKIDIGLEIEDPDGKKKVKWSDSTELREKMKEYRRSQFSMVLDYQHIAVDEAREREGVKKWREIKERLENAENEEEEEERGGDLSHCQESDLALEDDNDENEVEDSISDSDDDPYCDAALESKLRVIKAKASRFTLLPAYTVAVNTYEIWFASQSPSSTPKDQLVLMKSQLDLYKQILDLYGQWNEEDDVDKIDIAYQGITKSILDAKKLVTAPKQVVDSMETILSDEENIKKHRQTYSSMVEEMVTDLSKQIETTL